MTPLLILAAAEPGIPFEVLLLGIILVTYLFMFRPAIKKQKETRKFRENLAKGDRVVTVGGLHGTILEVNDKTVLLRVEEGKIRVDVSGISAEGAGSAEAIQAKG